MDVFYWPGGLLTQADWLGPKVGSHLALFLYSLREPGELSQYFERDNSTVRTIVVIIIRPGLNSGYTTAPRLRLLIHAILHEY